VPGGGEVLAATSVRIREAVLTPTAGMDGTTWWVVCCLATTSFCWAYEESLRASHRTQARRLPALHAGGTGEPM
jgi:hypothetical protein